MEQTKKRTISIKQKLIITSLLLLLIPSLLIGFVAYNQAKQKITDQILQSAHAGVDRMNDEIMNIVDPMRRDVAFFADRIDGMLYQKGKQNLALKEKMTEYLDTHPQAANLYYATTAGEMVIYPEQSLPDDYDPRERPWYQAAEEAGGKVVITDPYVDAASGKMMVTLSQTGGDGRGVIAVDVDVDRISEIAKKLKSVKKVMSRFSIPIRISSHIRQRRLEKRHQETGSRPFMPGKMVSFLMSLRIKERKWTI